MDDDEPDDDYTGFNTAPEDQDATIPCPHCGEDVHDDAEQCPACGQFLSQEDAPAVSRPWWILVGVAICILIVIAWALGRM
jgi:endogenous inhibitor of DNA gyrase (YacG/DUF329 family)